MNRIEIVNKEGTRQDFARLKAVVACASRDAARLPLTKVLVEKDGGGITVTATDGRRLRRDRFGIKAGAGVYDIVAGTRQVVTLAKSSDRLAFPDYRQAIPACEGQAFHEIRGTGRNFVLWAAAALGCYLDPQLIALGEDEAVTLCLQKQGAGLSPAVARNERTTLVVMPFRVDHQWSSQVEAIKAGKDTSRAKAGKTRVEPVQPRVVPTPARRKPSPWWSFLTGRAA